MGIRLAPTLTLRQGDQGPGRGCAENERWQLCGCSPDALGSTQTSGLGLHREGPTSLSSQGPAPNQGERWGALAAPTVLGLASLGELPRRVMGDKRSGGHRDCGVVATWLSHLLSPGRERHISNYILVTVLPDPAHVSLASNNLAKKA